MRPEDIREFTRRQPFIPYRIHITSGQTYDIYHPDQLIVLRSRVIIGVGSRDSVPEHSEPVALIHIVRLEELQSERSSAVS